MRWLASLLAAAENAASARGSDRAATLVGTDRDRRFARPNAVRTYAGLSAIGAATHRLRTPTALETRIVAARRVVVDATLLGLAMRNGGDKPPAARLRACIGANRVNRCDATVVTADIPTRRASIGWARAGGIEVIAAWPVGLGGAQICRPAPLADTAGDVWECSGVDKRFALPVRATHNRWIAGGTLRNLKHCSLFVGD